MNRNWLKYLGLLGFLGLLGLFTSNVGFYGFFGFFGFFGFARVKNDERLMQNANRACRNAFFVSLLVYVVGTTWVGITGNINVFAYAFVASYVLQILVFTFSFQIYDGRGE